VVLEGGEVVESGGHEELMARGGLYRSLHDAQFGGASPAADEQSVCEVA
jgi:ATP-binding cassette subfamily B protein